MNKNTSAAIFSLAIIIAAGIGGWAVINRNHSEGVLSVTGLGATDFMSDLIVWEGSFEKSSYDLKDAYASLAKDKQIITEYLVSKGIDEKDIVFNSVNTRKNTRANYSNEGRYIGEDFLGYILTQTLQIESKEVEKIEKLSREITELLNKGVQFYSQPPRYYYTKLSDLKIELISKATEDARVRAEKIADNAGSKIGKLISADMGIFQITGQNSSEEYSWGGTFNTESKAKTASITMRLKYQVD